MAFSDVVNQTADLIVAAFKEKYPELDLRENTPIYDLMVQPFRELIAQAIEPIQEKLDSTDITDPNALSEEIWDKITAIHFMPRKPGEKARGTVRALFSKLKDVVVEAGESITIEGKVYHPLEAKRAVADDLLSVVKTPASISKPTNNVRGSVVSLQETAQSSIRSGSYVVSVSQGDTPGSFMFSYNGLTGRKYSAWPANGLVDLEGGPGAGRIVLAIASNPPNLLPAQDVVNVVAAEIQYGLDIDIVADQDGREYEAPQGVDALFQGLGADPDFDGAQTVSIITGGLDRQTNASHLQDLRQGIGVRNLVNRRSIRAVLPRQFPEIESLVVVGYQEPEMRRDRIRVADVVAGPVEIALGNKADIYVKTPMTREVVTVEVPSSGVISLAEYGTVLKVHDVTIPSSPGQIVFHYTKSKDPTLWISARDELQLVVDPALIGKKVQVDFTRASGIREIQAFVDSEDERILLGDLLVRSYIPVWVQGIIYVAGAKGLENSLKRAVGQYVESLNTGEADLPLSAITSVIQQAGAGYVVQQFDLQAEIFHADGTRQEIVDERLLRIPTLEDKGFTPRIARWVAESIEIVNVE